MAKRHFDWESVRVFGPNEMGHFQHLARPVTGEIKVSTSTVADLFSKMALTGERIGRYAFASFFSAFPYLP